MTQRIDSLSRRSMFSLAAGSASALALGRVLGGTAHAAAPAAKAPPITLGKGLLKLPTDSTLDPELQILAEKLLARSKQAVLTAATKPGQISKDDKVAYAASKIVGSLRSKRVGRLQANIVKPVAMKSMEKFGKFEASEGSHFYAADVEKIVAEKKIKREKKIKKKKPEQKKEEPQDDKPQWTGPLAARIEYQLNAVKCVNMTDGESGSDEILLGGHLVTPGGVIKQIDRFKVSDDFDTGEVRRYDFHSCKDFPKDFPDALLKPICPDGNRNDIYQGRKLGATLLGLDKPWPATIGLALIMGEEDPGGGFGAWLQDVYGALEGELNKQLAKWGVQLGTALADELGAAIGEALAHVVGEFIGWLVNLLDNKDDPIAAKSWITKFNSPEMSSIRATVGDPLPAPSGIIASSPKRLDFVGDGGKYEVRMHWRVNA